MFAVIEAVIESWCGVHRQRPLFAAVLDQAGGIETVVKADPAGGFITKDERAAAGVAALVNMQIDGGVHHAGKTLHHIAEAERTADPTGDELPAFFQCVCAGAFPENGRIHYGGGGLGPGRILYQLDASGQCGFRSITRQFKCRPGGGIGEEVVADDIDVGAGVRLDHDQRCIA